MTALLPILVSCVPSPAPSATSVDSGVTSTSTTPTTSAVPMACAAVSGTRSVWLVDRADPTQHAEPTLRPSDDEMALDLSGPDAAGWLYLLTGSAYGPVLLHRSSDAGCTWSLVGESPGDEDSRVYTSPGGAHVYVADGTMLYVSTDAGVTFSLVSDAAPAGRGTLGVVPGDPDHLWAYDDVGILESPDGGVTWEARQAFPNPYAGGAPRFDLSVDPPRVASSDGGEVLWVWDGAWTERAKGHEDFATRGGARTGRCP